SDPSVIKIDAHHLTDLPITNSSDLRAGDLVIARGHPFGLTQTVTPGRVSALGRHGLGARSETCIRTDASAHRRTSRAALSNRHGELIGLNTAPLSRSGGHIGIGFAIPGNLVMKVYHQIVKDGAVQRGRLGVIGQNLTNDLAKAFGLAITQGVIVAQVMD